MEQPRDVNLAHLSKYLGKSKALMDASPSPRTSNVNEGQAYDPNEEKPLPDLTKQYRSKTPTNPVAPIDETAMYNEAVSRSNFSEDVKRAMINSRIQSSSPGYVADPSMPTQQAPAPQRQAVNEQITPTQQNHTTNISKAEMRVMMKEVLSEMMMETISEATIKKTLGKMLSEGKLKIKSSK